MLDKFPFLLHGGDYNPDQWRHIPGTLDQDFRLFPLAGINSVSVGIFSWAALEPEEGRYDFGWLDEVMDRCADAGMAVVLATPSGAKPNWMAQKYPEIRRQNPHGWCTEPVQELQAGRHNHCLTSPIYRAKVAEMDRRLAERYGKHPALALWHISNEFGGECHCPLCMQAFRDWLRAKYKTLDEMNHAWWTGFWSHAFSDWSQIVTIDTTIEGLQLDWHRFVSDSTASFLKNEADALKSVAPEVPVTTNFMGFYEGLDYNRMAKHVDVTCWDCYPAYHDRPDQERTAAGISLAHDLCRSFKKQPFLLMESSPGPTNWMRTNRLLRPGLHRLKSLQAVAHGSDSVQYFQIRKGRGGAEKFHGAVIDHVGDESPRMFREVAQVGRDLKALQGVLGSATPAEVALVHDWENRWALRNSQGPSEVAKDVIGTGLVSNYIPYWKRGVPVDVISPADALDGYKVVIAPICYLVQDGFAEKAEAFVRDGGTFIATFLSGVVDKNVLVYQGGFPGPFRKLFGIWAEEIDYLYPEERNESAFAQGNALGLSGKCELKDICEVVHLEGAEALGVYRRDFYVGSPTATLNRVGKGQAIYIAAHGGHDWYDALHDALISRLGLRRALEADLPEGVTATLRVADDGTAYTFVENFANEPREVDLGAAPRKDLLSGWTLSGKVPLQPYGVLALRG
jgi:beta-galactosidase